MPADEQGSKAGKVDGAKDKVSKAAKKKALQHALPKVRARSETDRVVGPGHSACKTTSVGPFVPSLVFT